MCFFCAGTGFRLRLRDVVLDRLLDVLGCTMIIADHSKRLNMPVRRVNFLGFTTIRRLSRLDLQILATVSYIDTFFRKYCSQDPLSCICKILMYLFDLRNVGILRLSLWPTL